MRAALALALVALVASIGAPAAAQSRQEVAEARGHWERGRALAEDGDWAGARDAFEASLAIVPRASTLISLATAEVHLGHGRAALAALERLAEVADPRRDRAHLEAAEQLRPRADELAAAEAEAEAEAARVEAEPEPEPEPEPESAPAPEPSGEGDVLAAIAPGIAIAGVGLLSLIASSVTFALRQDALSARDARCPDAMCATSADREAALGHHADAATLNDVTNALLVVGLVGLAGGGALVAVGLALGGGDESGEGDVAVAPHVGPGGGGVSLEGSF